VRKRRYSIPARTSEVRVVIILNKEKAFQNLKKALRREHNNGQKWETGAE